MSKSITVNGHTWTRKRISRSAYMRSDCLSLFDAYRSPSERKVAAYHRCKNLMREIEGYGFRITGHNSQMFTVMFEFEDWDTGEVYMAWITPMYDYACPLADCE